MLLGAMDLERTDQGIADRARCDIMKMPRFYQNDCASQRSSWYSTVRAKTSVASAHRQNGFDYRQLDSGVKVVSIVPDMASVIARRIMHIDTWPEQHPVLSKLYSKLSPEEKVRYTTKIIHQWTQANILDSDIKIPMSDLYQCREIGLGYSDKIIDDIYQDMRLYADTTSKN